MPAVNKQELMGAVGEILDGWGIRKAAGGSINLETVNFDNTIPRDVAREMINLTTKQNEWLDSISQRTVDSMKGHVSIYDLDGQVMEYVGEQDPNIVTTRPTTRTVPYSTKKFRADIVLSYEEIREANKAAEAGDGDFEDTVTNSFITQLGNNVAEVSFNGNTSLTPTTRENRMLRGINGIDIKTAGANLIDLSGQAFDKSVFAVMRDRMPRRYRKRNKQLRWWYNTRLANYWQQSLTKIATPLGDQALVNQNIMPPMGIQPIIIDDIPDDLGGAAIAPTSATDNTTYLTFVLTTLVTAGNPATAAAGVGRQFKVTNINTGHSEICTGYQDGSSNLAIDTTGLLGQTSVSETPSDYLVQTADESQIYLGDPLGVHLIWCDEVRSAREYNKNLDQFEITFYLELDILIPVTAGIVKTVGIAIPPMQFPQAA